MVTIAELENLSRLESPPLFFALQIAALLARWHAGAVAALGVPGLTGLSLLVPEESWSRLMLPAYDWQVKSSPARVSGLGRVVVLAKTLQNCITAKHLHRKTATKITV